MSWPSQRPYAKRLELMANFFAQIPPLRTVASRQVSPVIYDVIMMYSQCQK